ncbi:hypothetical protein EON65_09225 [archaeon]|nr:MAG: hypothetical protein EON65_09225 [archaeon]
MVLIRLTNLVPWIRGNLAFQGPVGILSYCSFFQIDYHRYSTFVCQTLQPILSSLGDYSAAPLADNLLSTQIDQKAEK